MMEQLLNNGTKVVVQAPNLETGEYEQKELTLRRLDTRDVFTFARMLSKIGKQLLNDLSSFGSDPNNGNTRELGLKIISLLPDLEDEAIKFLSSLVNVTPEEFEKFSMDSLIDIVVALVQSQDIKAFFNKAKGILNLNN